MIDNDAKPRCARRPGAAGPPSAWQRAIAAVILLGGGSLAAPLAEAEPIYRSGYAVTGATCGEVPRAYPKLPIDMREGLCAGLVADKDDGLIFPRSILQIPGHREFVVADMGGWGPGVGRLLLLDPEAEEGRRTSELITRLDFPFGLQLGPDGKIYASTSETIFRFDPLAPNPKTTVETIIHKLPGQTVTLSDGSVVEDAAHPLKAFLFDRTGRLFVNIGAPTDNCLKPFSAPCAAGEGPAPMATIWVFTPPAGGVFPALKPGDPNPPREIYARGLRNSLALAMHPQFPEPGFAFLQGENGRDLPDMFAPNEEINALESGRHYGWPYCYDLATESPEFDSFLKKAGPYQSLCANTAWYKPPVSLLPPHSAPLSMLYYHGSRFSDLNGKLLVSLHGYRPTGSRVLAYDVDDKGLPILSPPPVHYRVSCGPEPTRAFRSGNSEVAAAAATALITDWHRVNGVRPQGAPVGMTVAADGAIWLVEDRNQTVIRIDTTPDKAAAPLPCDTRAQGEIERLVAFVKANAQNTARLSAIRGGLIEKHCLGCHADFGLQAGQSDAEKDEAVLRFMLAQDDWMIPGDPDSGKLRERLRGFGAERLMPPGGEDLAKTEPGYARLLDQVDLLVSRMVPGTRMVVKPGPVQREFVSRVGKKCGSIPTGKVVVVTERQAKGKPGFSRFYRPADIYLDGACSDEDGYYIQQRFLVPL